MVHYCTAVSSFLSSDLIGKKKVGKSSSKKESNTGNDQKSSNPIRVKSTPIFQPKK